MDNWQGWSLCLLWACTEAAAAGGGHHAEAASGFSVPVVLLLTETGVAQDGLGEAPTAAPTAGHGEDNSLVGYTGTGCYRFDVRRTHRPSFVCLCGDVMTKYRFFFQPDHCCREKKGTKRSLKVAIVLRIKGGFKKRAKMLATVTLCLRVAACGCFGTS